MIITPPLLKNVFSKKGYKWYEDRPNLVGIRTTLQVPNVFNDILAAVWKQPSMPAGLTILKQQKFLNSYLFSGTNGLPLSEDGKTGNNTKFALESYNALAGKYNIKSWVVTVDPGTYWLNYPLSNLGAAILKPGQYIDSWSLGFHQGKPEHPALVQVKPITVYRDNDKDNIPEEISGAEEKGLFGINIHRSNANSTTLVIDKWSAGCQVFPRKSDHDQLRTLLENYKAFTKNFFTYALVKESDLG